MNMLPPPPPKPWTGAGKPPVGSQCEVQRCGSLALLSGFQPCVIKLYDGDEVVYRLGAEGDGDLESDLVANLRFRRFRTPEMIEDELRLNGIQDLLRDAGATGSAFCGDPEAEEWAASAWDAGWRNMNDQLAGDDPE